MLSAAVGAETETTAMGMRIPTSLFARLASVPGEGEADPEALPRRSTLVARRPLASAAVLQRGGAPIAAAATTKEPGGVPIGGGPSGLCGLFVAVELLSLDGAWVRRRRPGLRADEERCPRPCPDTDGLLPARNR